MASDESERNFEQHLQGIEFPATKEEVVSAAKSHDAPQHLIEYLEGLSDNANIAASRSSRWPRALKSRQPSSVRVNREGVEILRLGTLFMLPYSQVSENIPSQKFGE